jgi:non-haem Fe2+, alpha-ketoglutarate-dependent halogenase
MSKLSSNQLQEYNDAGYVAPIEVLTKDQALEIRKEIENIETKWPNELKGIGRNYIHMISPPLDEVCHNSKILDAVESIIGKNILICGTTLFIKNPYEKGFVSFHQDATYIGLEPHNWVTAWIAITDANEENGCMRMWSGSHKDSIKHHEQKYDKDNLLTRGQTVENVPLDETTPLILKAGQMSLHHPKIVHGSGLNKSNDRRIGFVVQSYIGTDVNQVIGKMHVQQARGNDTYKYHQHTRRPNKLMDPKDSLTRKKANDDLQNIFYPGSTKKGIF